MWRTRKSCHTCTVFPLVSFVLQDPESDDATGLRKTRLDHMSLFCLHQPSAFLVAGVDSIAGEAARCLLLHILLRFVSIISSLRLFYLR